MGGKSNNKMAPAPPGRPFRTLLEGIKKAPEAPSRGRKKTLFKRTASERKDVCKSSRSGLVTTGTGITSAPTIQRLPSHTYVLIAGQM
jgi:hypothetical protein